MAEVIIDLKSNFLHLFNVEGIDEELCREIAIKHSTKLRTLENDEFLVKPRAVRDAWNYDFQNWKIGKVDSDAFKRADNYTLAIIMNACLAYANTKTPVSGIDFFLEQGNKGSRSRKLVERDEDVPKGGDYFWRYIYEYVRDANQFDLNFYDYLFSSKFRGIRALLANSNMPESFRNNSEAYWDVMSLVIMYPKTLEL